MDDRYRLYSSDDGENYELYDLRDAPGELNDISGAFTEITEILSSQLKTWLILCQESLSGNNYQK